MNLGLQLTRFWDTDPFFYTNVYSNFVIIMFIIKTVGSVLKWKWRFG